MRRNQRNFPAAAMRKKGGRKDHMKRNGKILGAAAAGCVLIGGIIFCQFVYKKETVSAKEVKEVFSYEEGALIPAYNLGQEQKLVFDFALDYENIEYGLVEESGLVTVHTAPSCGAESEIACYVETEERDGGTRLTVAPADPVLANDSLSRESVETFENNSASGSLEEYRTFWGCAPVYYICLHYDIGSGEPVKPETPRVIPFTVKSESEVPNLVGTVNDQGELTLSWSPVEGADYYTVYQYLPSGSWVGSSNESSKGAEYGYGNGLFHSLAQTEQTRFSDLGIYESSTFGKQSMQNLNVQGCFFVTATVEGKESNLSAPVDTGDLKLPYKFTDESVMWEDFYSVNEFPEMLPITNIDGSVMQRPVDYRLRSLGDAFAVYDYRVRGTLLGGQVRLSMEKKPETPVAVGHAANTVYLSANSQLNKTPSMAVKSILAQDKTGQQGSDLYEGVQAATDESVLQGDGERVLKPDEDIAVFADSAEEAWLAYGLIAGETEISLKAFPSLQNPYVLEDVFLKVCLQNPYILGVSSYSYDFEHAALKVGYAYGKREIGKKQKKIYTRASEIAKEIFTEDMSGSEKEMQIYLWLEQNCRYAEVEWEQAKDRNFFKGGQQARAEDALNAYGALIKGEALCQGYAGAFQILGEMAGLKVRTVNGYLNGNIPHAWNLVDLDGSWYQIDCSSNRNTVLVPFYLYNADMEFAEANGYVFSHEFMLEGEQEETEERCGDDSREYYRYHGLTAGSMEEAEEILNQEVHRQVIAFRYTGEKFDESEFIGLVRKVFLKNGEDERLSDLQYRRVNDYIVIYEA